MAKQFIYAVLGIFLCVIVGVADSPSLTPEESYFFRMLINSHKQNQLNVKIKQLTQFKWTEVIWVGSYGAINPKIKIGDAIQSLSNYNADLQQDGAWALVFINDSQITTIIQGKPSKLFGKYRYLSFSRKNPPIEKQYYPGDIIKMNDTFEFTIIRGSK